MKLSKRRAPSTFLTQLPIPTIIGSVTLLIVIISVVFYYRYTTDHLPPNITINNSSVGGMTFEEARNALESRSPAISTKEVVLNVDDVTIASSSAELGLRYDYNSVLEQLKNAALTGRLRDQIKWRVTPLFVPQTFTVVPQYDSSELIKFISHLNAQIEYEGIAPSVILTSTGKPDSIKIFAGKQGRTIDIPATVQEINNQASSSESSVAAVVASTSAELTEDQVNQLRQRTGKFVGKSILFSFDNKDFTITDKELVSFIEIPEGHNTNQIDIKVASLSAQIDRAPQEPVFEYNPQTLAVTQFSAPLNGQTLNQSVTREQIVSALTELENISTDSSSEEESSPLSYELVVATTPPQTSLADTNDLGIKERIGFGDSHYDHSIPNRIHNVALTTSRITNTIVPPGAEFSFNKTLGDVSSATGFRSAYVIKNGQTSLGDGGGVCQVSTTLFRSVLDAGLKVTRRLPHSYRVSYYELDSKPGVDATVYSGETDFRFVNDTGHYILIHGEADSKNLYMYIEIYGTSDGRTTELVDHKTWNYRPAPAPQYFPDPTLPQGKLRQVDWAAPGISASFVNVIKDKDGKIIREDKYTSNYRPWSAKYMQGTGPAQ